MSENNKFTVPSLTRPHRCIVESRRELSGVFIAFTGVEGDVTNAVLCCENETQWLSEKNLHSSTNTQTKLPLCGLSPPPGIGADGHCLSFLAAVYFQNDYCTAHTICERHHCERSEAVIMEQEMTCRDPW